MIKIIVEIEADDLYENPLDHIEGALKTYYMGQKIKVTKIKPTLLKQEIKYPEKKIPLADKDLYERMEISGWNEAIKEFKKLNPV